MSRFCGFRSLWRTFRLWQKARPFNSWYMNDCIGEREKTRVEGQNNHGAVNYTLRKMLLTPGRQSKCQYGIGFSLTFTVSGSRSPLQLSKYFFKSCSWQETHISLGRGHANTSSFTCLGLSFSPDHNIQTPRLTSCHCATHRVVWRRQSSFKLMVVDITLLPVTPTTQQAQHSKPTWQCFYASAPSEGRFLSEQNLAPPGETTPVFD